MVNELRQYKKQQSKRRKLHEESLSKHYDSLTSDERRSVRTQLFIRQDGCCAICGIPEKELKRRLAIDHCHTKGHIRGLLCTRCNFVLGFAKDNPYILQSAIDYLLTERTFV